MGRKLKEPLRLTKIFEKLGIKNSINDSLTVSEICDPNDTREDSICAYIKGPLPEPKSGLILITSEPIETYECVIVDNPKEVLSKMITDIQNSQGFQNRFDEHGVSSNVVFGRNVVIEDDVEIGDGTIIEHNVVVHSGTKIGKNCLIRSNASIGGDGFGFFRSSSGALMKLPHIGGVNIGDNVEVGSNTCIVRGTLSDTVIEDDVKIDNLVHIAHDCYIGREAFVIAGAELSGYVSVGPRARVAPNVCVKQRVTIGEDAVVGMGAVVIRDVAPKAVVAGNPAKQLK